MSNSDIKLKDIFIGCADGESEAKNSLFTNIFYKNDKYNEIIGNPMKFIISGQKGTGKTILAKYIEKTCHETNSTCKLVNTSDLNLQRLIELGYKEFDEYELPHFFRWFILTEFSKILLNQKNSNLKFNTNNYLKKTNLILKC